MNDAIRNLSHDELIDLLEIYAKNLVTLDGTWFQSVERDEGMDPAMDHDREAWRRFSVSEARRIKQFLGLPEHPAGSRARPRAAPALPIGRQHRRDRPRRRRAHVPHRLLPRAERPRPQGHGLPPVQERRHRGVRRVRREHRRPHRPPVPELLSGDRGRHLQLRLEVHAESVRI